MIKAKVICDSKAPNGTRLLTFEVEFHRYILSELNTHRACARNAASTRAIPILRMLEQIANAPAMPVFYGKNQPGMSASEELDESSKTQCESIIEDMRNFCMEGVKKLSDIGLHKQHAGRYIEPWQMVKGVISATEWDNFFWLRDDHAAQPEIQELARKMKEAMDASVPRLLNPGEWHLPYVQAWRCDTTGALLYYDTVITDDFTTACKYYSAEEAIKISCARCAAVSFRNVDYNLEKCLEVYDRLVGSDKKHSSALEHCATPTDSKSIVKIDDDFVMTNCPIAPETWQDGISHADRDGNLWSGNFKGWVQYRKLIKGENYVKAQ